MKITPAFASSFWNVVLTLTLSNTASTATPRLVISSTTSSFVSAAASSTPSSVLRSLSGMPSLS